MDECSSNRMARRISYVEWITRDLESRIKIYENTLIGLDDPEYIKDLLNKTKTWLNDYRTEMTSLLEGLRNV